MEDKGYRYAFEAEKWTVDNPKAWEAIVASALEFTAQCRRFGMKLLYEEARFKMRLADEVPFKANNNYTAPLARKLIREHPEVKPYLETRRSVTDGVVLP